MTNHPHRSHNRSAYLGALLARAFPAADPTAIERAVFEMQRAAVRAQRVAADTDEARGLQDRAHLSALRAQRAVEPHALRLEFAGTDTLLHLPGHAEPIAVYR
jgi:hypothetical protein